MDSREFRARYGPWAVVAGGTTGIGAAYSRQLAARGLNVAIIGLEQAELDRLAEELPAEHSVEVRAANVDLGSAEVLEELRAFTSDLEVGLLIYNACHLEIGDFVEIDLDSHLKALYVNCRGPMVLSHWFGGSMAKRGRGGILLMASASACRGTSVVPPSTAAAASRRPSKTCARSRSMAASESTRITASGFSPLAVSRCTSETRSRRCSGFWTRLMFWIRA